MPPRHDQNLTIRISADGPTRVLGAIEGQVMECLWQAAPTSLAARAVSERVGPTLHVKHITIVTVLNNLWRKGLLSRRKRDRVYHYCPRLSRVEFVEDISRRVWSGMLQLGRNAAVTSFVDALDDLPADVIDNLLEKLRQHRGDRDGDPRY